MEQIVKDMIGFAEGLIKIYVIFAAIGFVGLLAMGFYIIRHPSGCLYLLYGIVALVLLAIGTGVGAVAGGIGALPGALTAGAIDVVGLFFLIKMANKGKDPKELVAGGRKQSSLGKRQPSALMNVGQVRQLSAGDDEVLQGEVVILDNNNRPVQLARSAQPGRSRGKPKSKTVIIHEEY